jgi:cytochrome c biogenesis protein CcmG/thiol:disulfide interchange protein DsbE
MRLTRATTLIATLLTLAIAAGCDRGDAPRNIGKPAPLFTLSDGSQTVDLAKLRGHTVLLNFWASFCLPCIDELPSLLALQHQMPNLTVVAISLDTDDTAYHRFLLRNHVDLLTIRDPDARINTLYGTAQIPETYVIDSQGILRRKFVNAQNWTNPEIVSYLKKIAN